MRVKLVTGTKEWGKPVIIPAGSINWLMAIANLQYCLNLVEITIGYKDKTLAELRFQGKPMEFYFHAPILIDKDKELEVKAGSAKEMELEVDILSHAEWLVGQPEFSAKDLRASDIRHEYCDTCQKVKLVRGKAFAIGSLTIQGTGARMFRGQFTCNECAPSKVRKRKDVQRRIGKCIL